MKKEIKSQETPSQCEIFLHLEFDSDPIIDSSQYNTPLTVDSVVVSSSIRKLEASSGEFINTNSKINPDNQNLQWLSDPNKAFTIEAWVYPTQLPVNPEDPLEIINSWYEDPSSWSLAFRHRDPSDSTSDLLLQLTYIDNEDTQVFIASTNLVVVNSWNHVAVCRNTEGEIKIFLNGIGSKANKSGFIPPVQSPMKQLPQSITIGGGGTGDDSHHLYGYMDNLLIINDAIYTDSFLIDYWTSPHLKISPCESNEPYNIGWYSVQDPEKPSVCLCVNDGNNINIFPPPILYPTESECMNSECPLPPIVCEMTISSAQIVSCSNGIAKFLIETASPEYDAVIQMKIGDGVWNDVEKYNGSSAEVEIPLPPSNSTVNFRLYKYVCEDQRCFISWPNISWDQPPPESPTVVLTAVGYEGGDLMKITNLKYKYVPPYYIPGPGGTPALPLGDFGEVHGGTLSPDSTRDPVVGEIVKVEPEEGDSSTVGAVYRIIKIENLESEDERVITLECANYLCDDVKQNMVGWSIETIYAHKFVQEECILTKGEEPTTIVVKVGDVKNKGQRILFDDKYETPFFLTRGAYYRFDLSDPSNANDQLSFSVNTDGRDSSGNIIGELLTSPGVTVSGTPGTDGAYIDIVTNTLSSQGIPIIPFKPDNEVQEFYFFSKDNPNRGGTITMATKSGNDSGDEDSDDGSAIPSAPCGGGHVCDRAKFDIFINGVLVLESNLNNLPKKQRVSSIADWVDQDSLPSSKFGGPWSPLPSGIGEHILDRRCVTKITEEQNAQIFAAAGGSDSDSDRGNCSCGQSESETPTEPFEISIIPHESNKNPHTGITWVRLKNRCGQTVYSCCIGQFFCPDCPPPQDC
jgi:hypothetical protein